MTPPTERTPERAQLPIRDFTIRICDACYALEGEMCHNPECIFCRRTMKEVGEYLDVLRIRPVVDGERLDLHPKEDAPPSPERSPSRASLREWQPIETAPKNARAVIGKTWDGHIHPVWWNKTYPRWDWCGDGYHSGATPRLTHWMPLPPAPDAALAGQEPSPSERS